MKTVYVCSAYRGDTQANVMNAKRYARFVFDAGFVPVVPHLMFPQFVDEAERKTVMAMDMELLGLCDELWAFGESVTDGMAEEIARAKDIGMPVRYYHVDLTSAGNGGAAKSKIKRHAAICREMTKLYQAKNRDYGDSFHATYAEEGMAMPRIRLSDKLNRFKRLTRTNEQAVKTESVRDTLIDMANYAVMTILEMDGDGE